MSIKTTQSVDRAYALAVIIANLGKMSNELLGDILDVIASSEEVDGLSCLDNFLVGETSRFSTTASADALAIWEMMRRLR